MDEFEFFIFYFKEYYPFKCVDLFIFLLSKIVFWSILSQKIDSAVVIKCDLQLKQKSKLSLVKTFN